MDSTLKKWIEGALGEPILGSETLRNDASFRCYSRILCQNKSSILMSAPPEKENCQRFVEITALLHTAGIRAPVIYAQDTEHGYLLLEDFGNTLLLDCLHQDTAEELYQHAIGALIKIQAIPSQSLEPFDTQLLLQEMNLFSDWHCAKHLKYSLNDQQRDILHQLFFRLSNEATQQPQVFVHRDYHSRNLMLLESTEIGVLDYQDAVKGPIAYDLVSLLKDCYIKWSQPQINAWVDYYLRHSHANRTVDTQFSRETFVRWFDLMGVQRHLKAIGIFARLSYRDNKNAYLAHIPRALSYIHNTLAQYREFNDAAQLLQDLPPAPS